jgi:multiple sugar transport system substrate-binding protein
MIANPAALEKAKKELPDDTSWTWDQWVDLAKEISSTGGGVTGAEYNFNPAFLQIYAAQRGEKFYDGNKIGMSADTIKSWWAIHQKLIETKGSPDAAKSAEIGATGPEQSLLGTSTGAMGMWWSNQLNALAKSSGQEMTLLRMPKTEGATTGGMFLQPAMFYTASAKSEHPAEAAKLIDFLVNDPDAAATLLSDRGLPTNAKVLAAVKDKLPEVDQKTLTFIDEVKGELSPIQAPPKGALEMEDILKRNSEEVMFGRATPDDAAQKFLSEANAAIAG